MQPNSDDNQDQPIHDEGEIDYELKNKIPLTGHDWRQQGPYIICRSCPIEHGAYVGIDTTLVGIDEGGIPKFVKRG